MKFDWFFNKKNNNDNEDGNVTGGAANANISGKSLSDADFSEDDDFFIDIESWGERIAIK